MRRIGIDLLNQRKAAAAGRRVENKKIDDEIVSALDGRDLLSVLVKANTDPDLGETKRLSDEDVLGRESDRDYFLHRLTGNQQRFRFVLIFSEDLHEC